jgi:hypothetical protein
LGNKVRFAAQICPLLSKESLASCLDLATRLDQAVARIRLWNGLALK